MPLKQVSAGDQLPEQVNVIIEIPSHSDPVKYEVGKDSGALFVDRFMQTSMHYPCNYGYVPQTLSEDGDPVDVLVVTPFPLISGSVIACRLVGMLEMEDEKGQDNKLLAVPVNELTPLYTHVFEPADLPATLLNSIAHFFEHYKDLDSDKWVKIAGWSDTASAIVEIESSLARFDESS